MHLVYDVAIRMLTILSIPDVTLTRFIPRRDTETRYETYLPQVHWTKLMLLLHSRLDVAHCIRSSISLEINNEYLNLNFIKFN